MLFSGKTAIVTGAAAHIGRAVALTLGREGAKVALVDFDAAHLEQVSKEMDATGVQTVSYVCDVSDEKRVNEVAENIRSHFGHIDILINNAGLWRCDWGPFAESDSGMWKRKIGVNILGTMYFTRAVINDMIRQHYGRIINLGSVAGTYGNANMTDYSMTKGAIHAFTLALAKEVAKDGITVNCVSPGNVLEESGKENTELSFIPRSGTPQENADLICFLASDKAGYISGQDYQIDGCRKKM